MQFGELLERTYREIHADIVDGVATSGTNLTIVDTALNGKYSANKFKEWVAFISRTTDGALPQGKYGLVSAYTSTPSTATIPDVGSGTPVDTGDEYSFCNQKGSIPIHTMEKLCNDGMKALGYITRVDTSLTVAASQIRYNLPLALKGKTPTRVYFRHPTTFVRVHAPNWEIERAAPGQQTVLVFKKQSFTLNTTNVFQTYVGYKIVIEYKVKHEPLTAFNSPVDEYIHDELAVAACVERAMWWKIYPRRKKVDVENHAMAKAALEEAKRSYPIEQPVPDQQRVPIGMFNR